MLKDPFDIARAVIVAIFLLFGLFSFLQQSGVNIGFQLAQVSTSCTDSDNGRNHFLSGYVVQSGVSYPDSCYAPTTLYENYCESGYRKSESVICPKGCSSNACVGSCYVGVTLKETKSGDSSAFAFVSATTTSQDASPLVNQYYSEEPSPFRVASLNSSKQTLANYEFWSGRYIIAETFSNPPQGEIIELPESVVDIFMPLDQRVRSLSIFVGTSTAPISSISLDESKLECRVGS